MRLLSWSFGCYRGIRMACRRGERRARSPCTEEDAVAAKDLGVPAELGAPEDGVTLADVARVARVSSATASRVLTGSPHVRPGTRQRVEAGMSQLGYLRQPAAPAARARRNPAVR